MTGNSTGSWRDRFEPKRSSAPGGTPAFGDGPRPNPSSPEPPAVDPFSGEGALYPKSNSQSVQPADEAVELDPAAYRPWILQRGRGRPAMMLDLRRYDTKSALWTGWTISYPHLLAMDYTGDRMLSLDFGARQFMIEGSGLDDLVRNIQQGTVLAVQEYAACIWQSRLAGPFVSAIHRLEVRP